MLEHDELLAKYQNNMYQTIIDNSPDFIMALNDKYEFITFNNAYQKEFQKIFGIDIAVGMRLADVLAHLPEELKKALVIFEKALAGENLIVEMEFGDSKLASNIYEIRLTPLYANNNQIIGASQIAQNISLRKQAEREIAQLNATLNQLVEEKTKQLTEQIQLTKTITDNTTSALFMMDPQGYPVFMNPAAERITGYTLEEIKHRPLHYAIHNKRPDGRPYPMEECPLDNSSAELRPMQNQEEMFVDKQGRLFPVKWSLSPLAKKGEILGAVIEFQDVTLEKKAEESRLAALELAKEQERQRAQQAVEYRQKQDEFIDTICHELRNPLNGIYGGLDMIKQKIAIMEQTFQSDDTPQAEMRYKNTSNELLQIENLLYLIEQCAEQQKIIVDDVLDLSKLEAHKLDLNIIPFNPKQLVQSLIEMFTPQIKQKQKKLKLSLHLSEADIWIKGDPHRLTQVITNLLSNAIKFTHEGGIIITVKPLPALDSDTVALSFTIEDTGVGMSAEEIKFIFNRFTQANRRVSSEYGGSGLGLSISKALINLMQGTIEVKSEKWQGTKVNFTIICGGLSEQEKLLIGKSKLKRMAVIEPPIMAKDKKNILIVEDNKMNQKILIHYLESAGYFCQVANDGQEAVDRCQKLQFDLILMDIEMPIMNGLEATKALRQREKEQSLTSTLIIGLSGNARKEQVQIALEAGMDGYLTKPIHKKTLYKKLNKFLFGQEECDSEVVVKKPKIKSENISESANQIPYNKNLTFLSNPQCNAHKQALSLPTDNPLPKVVQKQGPSL